MFTKKSHADVKKSTLKIQDCKRDSATRLRHLKTILEFVDIDEAKSVFESNYSHVYYILYDTFVLAESNLKQKVHKAHREELDGCLWLLGKVLCLLPELLARRWQCHSLGNIMSKLLHPGNSSKLRREGVRFFLLWYQALGDNAPSYVHAIFAELVPGLMMSQKGSNGPSEVEFSANDFLNHPNMKGEIGASVFHDTSVHPVEAGEIFPLLPPTSSERTAAPDPRDGLEVLLNTMIQTTACLKWRDSSAQKHMRTFEFMLQRFKDVYLPVFCPYFDHKNSIYDLKLELPTMRSISKREEVLSSCVVILVTWVSKFCHEKTLNSCKLDYVHVDDDNSEHSSLLSNLRFMGYTQAQLIRDVLYTTRDNVNFVHEVYRQAFLLGYTSKSQIEAIRAAITIYRDWMTGPPPPFLLETDENVSDDGNIPRSQRLRTGSYLGAITKENLLIRAGLQNVLQVFVTNAANVFLVSTANSNIIFPSKSNHRSSPLNEQTDICKKVLNVYRTMVMNTRMDPKTWEQLLVVLLQVTSIILDQPTGSGSKSANLGGRLGQAIFQTLIVTWIRAHTNVPVNVQLWEKFLGVLSSLTYRDELIIEWDKTMQTLTRVLARYVYNLNLQDLPLDRLAENKGKRRRAGSVWQHTSSKEERDMALPRALDRKLDSIDDQSSNAASSSINRNSNMLRNIAGSPTLNRSYSEGSLAPSRKTRSRIRRFKNTPKVPVLPNNVEHSLNVILSHSPAEINISCETLNYSRISNFIGTTGSSGQGDTLRRALSLDSLHRQKNVNTAEEEENESGRGSRSPSPTASSGIEGSSIKDSPMQIDAIAADSGSIDAQDDYGANVNSMSGRRAIILGGNASGWLPDVAAIMWKRMLGALGDVNHIPKPELHAQVLRHLLDMTTNLIKIKQNQGISQDNQSTPDPPILIPPIGIVSPWCYEALTLPAEYKKGKLWAVQLLCMLAKQGVMNHNEQLPLFCNILHKALTGEDRDMVYAVLKHLEGPRFLSLMQPGHTLLLLDLVHASAIVLTSFETGRHTPRAEVAALLGSLLCFPVSILPKPVLQPSEQIELMECPDMQDHVLNIMLRCARREPSARARCIALCQLGQWILQKLSHPSVLQKCFSQIIPHNKKTGNRNTERAYNPRIKEVVQVLLQALQFKHRTIARVAADALKLCAERGKEIAKIERLPSLIITSLCKALEIQNVLHPKDADKIVLTSLILCLGEFCMALPADLLLEQDNLILNVLRVLYNIAAGTRSDRIKLLTSDEDFDMHISNDDISEGKNSEANYQTTETTQNCITAIRLCAKTVAMHLVTHLGHFPMGIGASRLSSLVEEQDDASYGLLQGATNDVHSNRDSVDLATPQVLNAQNIQLFMLTNNLVASFIELPALRLPGGGVTAGLVTADRQVRVLLRDLNGKACWDASILYRESTDSKRSSDADNRSVSSSERHEPISFVPRPFQIGRNSQGNMSLDPMISSVGLPMTLPRHTLRHRPPNELPIAKDLAPDLDQLDDLLQYIGHTSSECLSASSPALNSPSTSPLGAQLEAQTISIILNQRAIEQDFVQKQNLLNLNYRTNERCIPGSDQRSVDSIAFETPSNSLNRAETSFQFSRLLFSQLGLAGWERRCRTHLLKRTEKLLRELRNVDLQKCRETHKMAVIYVASAQEDKNSILKNASGSSTYEMFVSALGWEIELETHSGFLGGLSRQGCGDTAPYYATPFLEVIYHVATRMPSDTPETILTKTRHLGNDEVHIVWSEHYRDYRRDILPTEFCDVLIVVYPLKNGLFRITVNRKPEVPWFGPLPDESVVSGLCLASLVRATAINASRAKRSSLPFFQQFYEERNRSLETVSSRYRESNTFEDFIARLYSPMQSTNVSIGSFSSSTGAPLAAALIDHQRSSVKNTSWPQQQLVDIINRDVTQTYAAATTVIIGDNPSPRPSRKLHPFKSMPKKTTNHPGGDSTPPESPTFPGRRLK